MTQELGVPAVEGQGSAQRLFREQDFHNRRFAEDAVDARTDVRRWYVAIREVRAAQVALLRQLGSGKAVLEYGCADGKLSIDELAVPRFVGTLDGIDISDMAIAVAREKARNLGIENTRFQHMDAERMTFADNSFDVVYGRGILHHLELDTALAELARVLRPGGTALFLEPLGHNPVLNWYRDRTPGLRTPDEHPLLKRDFDLARRHFSAVDSVMTGIVTPLTVLLPGRPWAHAALEAVDRMLCRLPVIRWQAWYSCLILRK